MTLFLALFLLAPPAVFATRANVMILDSVDGARGLCVAIPGTRCITAYHVVEGHGLDYRLTDHMQGTMGGRLGWFDKGKDLAIVFMEKDLPFSVSLARKMPIETESVWIWVIYQDRTIHLTEGRWAGRRAFPGVGALHIIDGYSEPGTSGSLVVNERGEGVAVVIAGINAGWPYGSTTVRALVAVQPIVGGVGKDAS